MMLKKPIAIQLYTLRNEMKDGLDEMLIKVADMGFDGVEFAGGYWGDKVSNTKKTLDEQGLTVAGSHVPFEMLRKNLDQVIDEQLELGSHHIICPILPESYRGNTIDHYKKAAEYLNQMGERCQEMNLTFSYHNHAFELEKIGDKYPLHILLDETNAEWVKAELDVYWIQKAGEDPLSWLQTYHDRTPLIHVKDMTTDGSQDFAPLGTGGVNLTSVLKYGERSSSSVEWWIFEQDQSDNPLDATKQSLNYLRGV